MKTIFLTMAAVSALSVAAPASAQPWNAHRTQSAELQTQIDAGIASGAITRRETAPLREGMRLLVALESQYSANGISGREHATLQQRSAALRQQINLAERTGAGRYNDRSSANSERRTAWLARYDTEHRAAWEERYERERLAAWEDSFGRDRRAGYEGRFDRPNRGDRFAGDVRVGQPRSARMTALPVEYRIEYPDSDQFYHGFDDDRIYRVDRRTGLILGLLDLPN
jgi:hypothetical protein